jgi:hypothetical protein
LCSYQNHPVHVWNSQHTQIAIRTCGQGISDVVCFVTVSISVTVSMQACRTAVFCMHDIQHIVSVHYQTAGMHVVTCGSLDTSLYAVRATHLTSMYAPKGTLLYAPPSSLLLLYSLQALQCVLLLQLLQSQPAAVVLVSAPTSTCKVKQSSMCAPQTVV